MKRITVALLLSTAAMVFALSCQNSAKTRDQPVVSEGSAAQQTAESAKPVPSDYLITPGQGIGKISINEDADSVITLLGRPDFTDAAMGSSLMTWYAKHDSTGYKTSIFSHRTPGGKDETVSHVRKIMVTSPAFKTDDGINTGKYLKELNKHFQLKPLNSYTDKGKKIIVYEALDKGAAFEVDQATGLCVAIVIHALGDTGATYINMH